MAVICCATAAGVVVLALKHAKSSAESANWERRWKDDTTFFADEVRAAAQKIAEESYGRVKAENKISALQTQVADLQDQLAAALRLTAPPRKEP